ncbi:hypothetical protein Gorai_024179 [Gossypium raimondii]|uniref:Uncharacterized protein n=1 Tax=Gossypium raimondii TaxID=29730 RepID=A0A7J8NYQ7_GOSRA|nr:hypothetical protein [Gossypium raimondii]
MLSAQCLLIRLDFLSVTDGPKGSYIGVKGEAVYIPPSPCVPVDTCGAARIAATVVGQQGTRLRVQDAVVLAESFAFNLKGSSSSVSSDVGSDHISSL